MAALNQTVALVGMMGAGKSALGRRLANRLEVAFKDADTEIEAAAGCSVADIFSRYGEEAFRDGERRVIARLLEESPQVVATGGGAFIDEQTRAAMKKGATTVWLRAPLELLLARTQRRDTRPLLRTGEPREIMERLLRQREPIYATADLTIDSDDGPHHVVVERMVTALMKKGVLRQ